MEGYDIKATVGCQIDRVRGITHLPANKAFVVTVVNRSFRVLSYGRIRDSDEEAWGQWFPIPPLGQNCFGDPRQCIEDGGGTNIFSVDADDAPFELELVCEPDDGGNAFGGRWVVKPTRDTIGQFLVVML